MRTQGTTSELATSLGIGEAAGAGLLVLAVLVLLNGVADALLKADAKSVFLKEWLGLLSAATKVLAALATFLWVTTAKIPFNPGFAVLIGVITIAVTVVVALFSRRGVIKEQMQQVQETDTTDSNKREELKRLIEEAVRAASASAPMGNEPPAPGHESGPATNGQTN